MDEYTGNDIAADFTDWDDFFGEADSEEEIKD
jgi:ribosome-associated heat shock protein Hsp15